MNQSVVKVNFCPRKIFLSVPGLRLPFYQHVYGIVSIVTFFVTLVSFLFISSVAFLFFLFLISFFLYFCFRLHHSSYSFLTSWCFLDFFPFIFPLFYSLSCYFLFLLYLLSIPILQIFVIFILLLLFHSFLHSLFFFLYCLLYNRQIQFACISPHIYVCICVTLSVSEESVKY